MRYIKCLVAGTMLASLAALGGCAVATPIMTQTGAQGFSIDCSVANDMGDCYKKAGELCGANGYKVYAKHNKSAGFFTSPDKSMVIQCNAPSRGQS